MRTHTRKHTHTYSHAHKEKRACPLLKTDGVRNAPGKTEEKAALTTEKTKVF